MTLVRNLALLLAALVHLAAPAIAQTDQQVPASSEPYVYEVEAINAGLAQPAGLLELDTPQALLESFMEAAEREDWQRAAGALDLGNLPPAGQADRGAELAARMYEILHRSIAIDWSALPDRPDAVDTRASDKNPMAGAHRRHITLGRLNLDGRNVPISIARLQTNAGEPVWLFSRQTVGNLPALYEEYGPTRFEQSLPDWLRRQAFWTLAWWEVIALPLVLLVAFGAGALTYLGINRQRKGSDHAIAGILRAVHLPATLLAIAGTFALVRNWLFTFSGIVNSIMNPLQIALIVIAIGAVVLAIVEFMIDFATDRRVERLESPENEDDRDFFTRMSAVQRILIVVVVIAGLGVVLVQSSITQTLGFSLLASAGVIGLVIAFAARKILGDIMASLQIAFARTARIGDAVQYEGQWCYVERIGFTHLRLRTWDERRVMAPVAEFVGSSFENWTKRDPSLLMRVPLYLDHRADIAALREEFHRIVAEDDDVIEKDKATLEVIDHTAQAMVARCVMEAVDPKVGWVMHCRIREKMIAAAARLDAAAGNEPAPAFLPREREVRMDLTVEDEVN